MFSDVYPNGMPWLVEQGNRYGFHRTTMLIEPVHCSITCGSPREVTTSVNSVALARLAMLHSVAHLAHVLL